MMQQIMILRQMQRFWSCIWEEGLINISVSSSCSATFYRLCQYHKAMGKKNKHAVTCDKCSNGSSSARLRQWELQYLYIYIIGVIFQEKKNDVKCVTGGFFHVPLACGFGERGIF